MYHAGKVLPCANQHNHFLCTRNRCVDKVFGENDRRACNHRNDDVIKFATLTFVNGDSIGECEFADVASSVNRHASVVKVDCGFKG